MTSRKLLDLGGWPPEFLKNVFVWPILALLLMLAGGRQRENVPSVPIFQN